MQKLLRISLISAASLCVCLSIFARGKSKWDSEAASRKAGYIYSEAQRQKSLDNSGAAFELNRRAYDIDSTNPDYYTDLAVNYIIMAEKDAELIDEGTSLLSKKFAVDPADYTNAYVYAQLLSREPLRRIEVLRTIDSLNPKRPDLALMYVDAMMEYNDTALFNKALSRLRGLEVTSGKSMELTRRITACYSLLNDSAAAINEIYEAIAASPLDAERYSFAGRFYEYSSQPDSALAYYRKACDIEPDNGSVAFELASYYKTIGDTAAYSREIDRTLLETDLDLEDKHQILLDYTKSLLRDSLYFSDINSIFDRVIARDPQAVDIRRLYAEFLALQEKKGAAAEQMDYVIDLEPEEIANWVNAALYHSDNDYPKAIEVMQRSLKYHGDAPVIHRMLGQLYYLNDNSDIANAVAETKLAYDLSDSTDIKNRSEYLTAIGDFYYSSQNMDSASVYYEKAIAMDPGNVMAKNNFAYHLSETSTDPETLAKAEKWSFETLIEDPNNPIYLDTYAWILFKQQDYKKAKEYIDRIINLPDDEKDITAEYYSHAGDIYYFNQLHDEALDFWKKALELTPDDPLLQRKVSQKAYFKN